MPSVRSRIQRESVIIELMFNIDRVEGERRVASLFARLVHYHSPSGWTSHAVKSKNLDISLDTNLRFSNRCTSKNTADISQFLSD